MRFLIDEDLPRAVSNLMQHYGYEAIDVRDTELKGAIDFQIEDYAKKE
jgi:predicted nuclease of predicted toxin-antitoxin system